MPMAVGASIAVAGLGALLLAAPVAKGAFPGENGRIAYEDWGALDFRIFSAEPDGTDAEPLTGPASAEPSYSADGRWIVYNRNWSIWRMRSDGSDKQKVIQRPEGRLYHNPEFSPSGRRVVFSSTGYGVGFIVGVGGHRLKRLGRHVTSPSWSPNGRWIAYTHEGKANTQDVYVMRPNGKRRRNLSRQAGRRLFRKRHEFNPDWSPGGRQLIFSADKDVHEDGDIWSMKLSGRNLRRRADVTEYDTSPVFSPDGSGFAFEGEGVMRVDFDDPTPYQVIPLGRNPTWQPR